MPMTKSFLISFLGGNCKKVAEVLGVFTQQVYKWPEELSDATVGRVAKIRPDVMLAWYLQEAQNKVK